MSSKIEDHVTQFNISPMTVYETQKVTNIKCRFQKQPDMTHDTTSVNILKLISPVFCYRLTKRINLSITSGVFPSKWKVTPQHKNSVHDHRENYRPISVLSVMSMLLEARSHYTLMDYLEGRNLLYHLQSAFQKGHSTESALM